MYDFSSANAAPEFEGRGGEELAVILANTLATAYESDEAFNTKELCILPGQQCWKLYVDILVSIFVLIEVQINNFYFLDP